MRRVALLAAAGILAAVALTGCGRLAHDTVAPPQPAPTVTTVVPAPDLGQIGSDLDGAASAGSEADGFLTSASQAAATPDEP